MADPILLLASNSPRRRRLLQLAGWSFHLHPVDIDESYHPGETPDAYVLRLGESKARAAGKETDKNVIILAADTTVADGQGVLGKPSDPEEAGLMLRRLRGRTHQVYTALALYQPEKGELISRLCCTHITMRNYSDEEIDAYIATGDPLDKAGAYAIQHAGFHPVASLDGCYTNVVGLPMCLLQAMLMQVGFPPHPGQPQPALHPNDYAACPLCGALARGEYAV